MIARGIRGFIAREWAVARPVLTVAFAAGLIGVPADSHACTCAPRARTCEAVFYAEAVFAATVIAVRDEPTTDRARSQDRRVRVQVTEAFRGDIGEVVDVFTARDGPACGFPFAAGRSYLIYAHRDPETGRLRTSICGRTTSLNAAGQDLSFLRGPARATSALGTIFGKVEQLDRRSGGAVVRTPFSTASVIAVGREKIFSTTADASGKYELSVPAGPYEIRVEVPPGRSAEPRVRRVEVTGARGCGKADMSVVWDGRVMGRLVRANGEPVPFFPLELVPDDPRGYFYFPPLIVHTDAQGRFEFARVQPGPFHAGVNTRSPIRGPGIEPRALLGGVSGSPSLISVSPGGDFTAGDLVLPPALSIVTLEGVVVAEDGSPRSGVRVSVQLDAELRSEVGPALVTDRAGRFAATVVTGYRYRLVAEQLERGLVALRGETAAIDASRTSGPITLQLRPLR